MRYQETRPLPGGGRAPSRWQGELEGHLGRVEYTAVASTPVAEVTPGGGFLGFEFQGRHTPPAGPSRELAGRGFAECGGRG